MKLKLANKATNKKLDNLHKKASYVSKVWDKLVSNKVKANFGG